MSSSSSPRSDAGNEAEVDDFSPPQKDLPLDDDPSSNNPMNDADGDFPSADPEPAPERDDFGHFSGGPADGGDGDDGGSHSPPNDDNPPNDSDDDEASLSSIPDFLPPDHPLLARVQAAMKRELVSKDTQITLQLREKTVQVKQLKNQREEIGVELYNLQQALARKQLQLEKIAGELNYAVEDRLTSEDKLKTAIVQFKMLQEQRNEQEKKRLLAQKELDQLKLTIQQIDQFNNKVEGEISVTKRVAYGTEEQMKRLEREKVKQDEMIAKLNESMSTMEKQIEVHHGQIQSQKAETMRALETLNEANREIALIEVEKKEYMDRWRSAVLGVNHREDAHIKAEKLRIEQMEAIQALQMQIESLRIQLRSEQELNEKNLSFYSRIESESRFLQSQLDVIQETRAQLSQKYQFLKETLESCDENLKKEKYEERVLQAEVSAIQQAIDKQFKVKQVVDGQIYEAMNSQTTMEKGAAGVWKQTQGLKKSIHEKEMEKNEIDNELARIRVDSLNTQAHNKELEATLSAYDLELKEKDRLIEKYEQEIRQRHDKIEKKQIYIARLNRKYESIVSTQKEEDHSGPLESTIKHLQKEIEEKRREMGDIQKNWIKTQTELVNLNQSMGVEELNVKESSAKMTIYEQKKLRLGSQWNEMKREIVELSGNMKSMRTDMGRLNEYIDVQQRFYDELMESNFQLELESQSRVKELEMKAIQSDSALERLKREKEELMLELIEVEKQIILWEKKIEIEKETQAAIDPEYGQPEIIGMRKEIHRMKLRLIQLRKTQEEMVSDMERVIQKREFIQLNLMQNQKYMGPNQRNGGIENSTTQGVKKQIQSLKGDIASTAKQNRQVSESIQKQEEQNSVLMEEFRRQQDIAQGMDNVRDELESKLSFLLFQKQMAFEATILNQKRAKRYEAIIKSKLGSGAASTTSAGTESSTDEKESERRHRDRVGSANSVRRQRLENELEVVDQKFQAIRSCVGEMAKSENNPKHAEWFKRLMEYM